MSVAERNKFYRLAFRRVLETYHEIKTVSMSSSCGAFYGMLARGGVRTSHNPKEVLPTSLDFIADVELAAESAIGEERYESFKRQYFDQYYVGKDGDETKDNPEHEVVGREFVVRKIHPTNIYLYVPLTQEMVHCKCGDRSHSAPKSQDVWCAGGCQKNILFHAAVLHKVTNGVMQSWCKDCGPLQDRKTRLWKIRIQ